MKNIFFTELGHELDLLTYIFRLFVFVLFMVVAFYILHPYSIQLLGIILLALITAQVCEKLLANLIAQIEAPIACPTIETSLPVESVVAVIQPILRRRTTNLSCTVEETILKDRTVLESTIPVWSGEMNRSPKNMRIHIEVRDLDKSRTQVAIFCVDSKAVYLQDWNLEAVKECMRTANFNPLSNLHARPQRAEIIEDIRASIDRLEAKSRGKKRYSRNARDDDYHDSDDEDSDNDEEFASIQKRAERGDPGAQVLLADHFIAGDVVDADPEYAFELYEKAAYKGDPQGMYALSDCYLRGIGTDKDEAEAFTWCTHAAKKGVMDARKAVAFYYRKGIGTERNVSVALERLMQIAEEGDPEGMLMLAKLYTSQEVESPPGRDAYFWASQAAAKGYEPAEVFLEKLGV